MARLWHPACRRGGSGGRGGGGRAVVPRHPPSGGGLWHPALAPLHGRRRGAASLLHAQPGLFGSPGRRARSGLPLVGQSGGGGGFRAPPHLGGSAGGPRRAGGGKVALLRSGSPPSPGGKPRWVASSLPRPPHGTGTRAAVLVRPTGCPCAPGLWCWPAAGTAGVGGSLTGGTRHTAARTAAMAPLPGCRGPLGGGGLPPGLAGGVRGCRPPGRPPAVRGLGGGGRGERGGGSSPLSPSGPLVLLPGDCRGAAWWSRLRGASR